MRNRYKVVLRVHDRLDPGFNSQTLRSFKTEARANAFATKVLCKHVVETTNALYHQDMYRSNYCEILQDKNMIGTIYPEVRIVPSVGELGYTP